LIDQGVPEGNLETQAYGKEKNLRASEVKQLIEQSPDLNEEQRKKLLQRFPTVVLAYNRRVDFSALPTGQDSAMKYPTQSEDFARLIDRNGPTPPASLVQQAAKKERIAN
jgi:hypothetical protein